MSLRRAPSLTASALALVLAGAMTATGGASVASGPEASAAAAAGQEGARDSGLRVEHTERPLGLDVEQPRFSWVVEADRRDVAPTAYRLVVASTAALADAGRGDVWDSGLVTSPRSTEIVYDGPALQPATRYHWRVQVRLDGADGADEATWSPTSWFETGIGEQGWAGSEWLSVPDDEQEQLTFAGAHWVWHPESTAVPTAPAGTRWFRSVLAGDGARRPVSAEVLVTADNSYRLFLDGELVGRSPDALHTWQQAQRYTLDLTGDDSDGGADAPAVLGLEAANSWEAVGDRVPSPAGVLVAVRLSFDDGTTQVRTTGADGSWRSSAEQADGWAEPGFDDTAWSDVVEFAPHGSGPWGGGVALPPATDVESALGAASWIWFPDGPAVEAPAGSRYFRRSFEVDPGRRLEAAELVMTADDRFTAYVNGELAGRSSTAAEAWRDAQVLALPGVGAGRNVVAVEAVNSDFAGGGQSPAGLLGVVRLSYADGSVELVPTDGSWRTTREAADGWRTPGFDDSGWAAATVRARYGSGPWGNGVTVAEQAPAPVLRTEFGLDEEVRSARLYVAGAGLVDTRLNGAAVSDEVLSVSNTDYTRRVHYATHDVTDQLREGPNALLVTLGRGFYAMRTQNSWGWEQAPWSQPHPAARLVLRVVEEDGDVRVIGSDADSWRQTTGPTTYDSLYEGEFYDARLELVGADEPGFDDGDWQRPGVVPGPEGRLTARVQPPIRIVETIAPSAITEPSPGVYVAAFPRQVAGWARIHVTGEAGDEVQLRYGERLLADGNVNSSTGFTGGAFQTDRYVLAGRPGGETWEPRFAYKGFKYVEITGWPGGAPTVEDIEARLLHTDVARTSTFASSEPLFDTVHRAVVDTVLNNFHHIPTDTPTYEKNGWTGDAALGAEMFLRNLDSHSFLTKWLDDVSDSRLEDGRPALIAPDPDWRWGDAVQSPTWHAAYVQIPWWLYEHTGDRAIIEKHYEGILDYVRLEHRTAVDHISSTGLGDYMSPDRVGNPPEDMSVSATAFVFEMTQVAADMADLLERPDDAAEMRAEAARIKEAFNETYYDAEAKVYRDATAGYRQTHNVLALEFGLVPEGDEQAVADHLARDVREVREGHLWTGVLGTKYLLPLLTEYGHGDLAHTVATQTDYPSWGRWFASAEGSTSTWEAWDDYRSRNHYFLGTIDDWFYEDLVGIEPTAPGYRELSIAPQVVGDMTRASGSLETPLGRVSSSWRLQQRVFTLDVEVPVGATATVSVPVPDDREVSVDGVLAEEADGVEVLGREDGRLLLRVGSGARTFRTEVVLGSKEECKDAGWTRSTLPVFVNQGDCVSHFARAD